MHDAHLHRYLEAHGAQDRTGKDTRERRTWTVVGITAIMMAVELMVGTWTGSLALFADGVHMGTHVAAIGFSALAYGLARVWAKNEAFTFGTGKVFSLAGYTSAIALAGAAVWMMAEAVARLLSPTAIQFEEALVVAAVWMMAEAVARLLSPTAIQFEEALVVAAIGLGVNLLCAKLLMQHGHGHAHHEHGHGHDHDHDHAHGHGHDPNMRAAYLHVLADALTSVLAIAALLAGRYLGLKVLDPVMGIVGGAIILHWSWGLVRSAARQLLDVAPSLADTRKIREHLEAIDDVKVADLHLWEIGPGERGCIVKIITASPRSARYYRDVIKAKVRVSHLTVEVQHCEEEHP